MTHSYIQVPPQSTGRKIATEYRKSLYFTNLSGMFAKGNTVTGATSGATGVISAFYIGDEGDTGEIYLESFEGNFIHGENIQVLGITLAQANVVAGVNDTAFDLQKMCIADPNNPGYVQRIDRFGATVNTFTDGAPVFGAFGTMAVGQPQIIREHRFAYGIHSSKFWDDTSTGTVTYDSAKGAVKLTTGTGNGEYAKRTSNQYHPYVPGIGQVIEISCAIGDTGKTNVRRRWGYYDDNNGVFFELDGTQLNVVLRTNSGDGVTVTESRIAQDDWNGDKLDGTDSIGFSLDVSKGNIYWIDMQWLGAGRVRFGVVETSGERLVAHSFGNANVNPLYPYMQTATLPIRIEQENTGIVGSTSEMRTACFVVKQASKATTHGANHSGETSLKTIASADGEVPLYAIRPKTTFAGKTNRGTVQVKNLCFTNTTKSGGGPVRFRVYRGFDTDLTADSFGDHGADSCVEIDFSATAFTGGDQVMNFTVSAGDTFHVSDLKDEERHELELVLGADGVTQPVIFFTAECLLATDAYVTLDVNWEEILL